MRNRTVGYTPALSSGTSGRRWILVGTAVALAAIALGAGFTLGRHTLATTAAAAPSAAGDFPLRAGIPIPARHTAAGAATAATNFQIAGFRVGSGNLDAAETARALLSAQATTPAQQVLAAPTGSAADLAKSRTSFAPISATVDNFSLERAIVTVWGVSATSSQITPQPGATEDWGRSMISMTWDGTQWRVVDERFVSGPWPVRADQRLATTDGDFSFRYTELAQGWTYVPEP